MAIEPTPSTDQAPGDAATTAQVSGRPVAGSTLCNEPRLVGWLFALVQVLGFLALTAVFLGLFAAIANATGRVS